MHLVMIGGSDAGISAALRARELDPSADVTVVVADAYPNFSICGIPYYVSGEVTHWRNLAHRTVADLEATGMALRLDTTARRIDVAGRKLLVTAADGERRTDLLRQADRRNRRLPGPAPDRGLTDPRLGPDDGVHVLHTMGDTFAVMRTLEQKQPSQRRHRRRRVCRPGDGRSPDRPRPGRHPDRAAPEVLPTVDAELGALVHAELAAQGVEVLTGTTAQSDQQGRPRPARQTDRRSETAGDGLVGRIAADMVLVSTGVRPDTALAEAAGATLGVRERDCSRPRYADQSA